MIKKDPDVDKALEYMEKHYPGPHTVQEIADFTGMSHNGITFILDGALKKIRSGLIDVLIELDDE